MKRLLRPTPRVALGVALRKLASAAVDVSDGLLADLGHIASRSGLAAHLDDARLPLSPVLRTVLGETAGLDCVLRGGDDYELCFTAAPAQRASLEALASRIPLPLTRIGQMRGGQGVHLPDDALADGPAGYEHFIPGPGVSDSPR